jgi:hypothetical protein
MERRELMIAIREYVQELPKEQQLCNGCTELKRQRLHGARGQMVTAFNNGSCRCDEQELIWADRGFDVLRPLECILNGLKTGQLYQEK